MTEPLSPLEVRGPFEPLNPRERGPRTEVGMFVGDRVSRLQGRIIALPDGPTSAALAKLRRAVGRPVAADPELWSMVFDGFPESGLGRGDLPSPAEASAHAALTLFAVHQQSKSQPMHVPGISLGDAVGDLGVSLNPEEGSAPPPRRFTALITAETLDEMLLHARGLIQQLRSASVGLDYGRLAEDLAALQDPGAADSVRLRWARDLHRRRRVAADERPDPADEN